MRRFLSFILAVTLLAIPFTAYAEEDDNMQFIKEKSYYSAILEKELNYFEQLRLECGAVGMYPLSVGSYAGMKLPEVDGIAPEEYTTWPSAKVIAYFSDTAVLGAIRADSALGTQRAKDGVLGYINWYISRMNTKESDKCGVAGTVYDYHIFQSNDGRTVHVTDMEMYASQYPKGDNPHDYDSTDSYAAMFLQILYEYAKYYDNGFLSDKAELVQTLINVIMSDYVPSLNLTVAKPNYRACYLMDNCEVYCGFVSAAGIYEEFLNDPEKAAECTARAGKVKNAILTRMWSSKDNCFLAAVSDNGGSMYPNDLKNFYPQASCQLFPVIFGIVEPDDEKAIVTFERFKTDFGRKWLTFDIETYPWCILVRAAIRMGDYEFAGQYIDAVNRRFVKRAHSAPYYNSESGSIMVAVAELYGMAPEDPAEEISETVSEEISETVSEEIPAEVSGSLSEPADVSAPDESSGAEGGSSGSALPYVLAGIGIAAAAAAALAFIFRKKGGKK